MTPEAVIPFLAGAALMLGSAAALSHRGLPRGRTAYGLASALAAFVVGFGGWLQTGGSPPDRIWFLAAWLASVLFVPLWIMFCLHVGLGPGQNAGGTRMPAAIAATASIALLIMGARDGLAVVEDGGDEGLVLALTAGGSRAAAGLFLLLGAAGVVRLQAIREAARREGRVVLHGAILGPLLISLGIFLFSSQALLYGSLSLRVVSYALIGVIPCVVLLLPAFRGKTQSVDLPPESSVRTSSLVLMSLGLFLIALAVFGQAIHWVLPDRGLVWFHWGGVMLVSIFASIWLVPAMREPLRRRLDPRLAARGDYRWEWARVNQALVPVESAEVLVSRLSSLADELFGRTTVALWLAEAGTGVLRPVSDRGLPLPSLDAENPLRRTLLASNDVLDLTRPPSRLRDLPLFVENSDLVERFGFRVFLALRMEERELGILGLAPRDRLDPDTHGLLENLGAQVSNMVWGMNLAEGLGRAREEASFYRLGSFVLHDLKNAVGVLKGIAANAPRHLEDPRFRDDLVLSLDATVERMEQTLRRLRTGMAGNPQRVRFSLDQALGEIVSRLRPIAERSGVRITIDTLPLLWVSSDVERFETILHNLIRNAVEATPRGGEVRVEVGRGQEPTAGTGARSSGWVELQVRDEGTGGDPEKVRKAFRGPVTSDKPGGWGIGLYQSALLAESIGSALSVAGGGGEGLCVSLRLPHEDESRRQPSMRTVHVGRDGAHPAR